MMGHINSTKSSFIVKPFLNFCNTKRYASTEKRLFFPLSEEKDPKVLRLDVSKYNGKIYLNLRKWFYKDADKPDVPSTLMPSRTGIVLDEAHWTQLKLQVSS